MNWTIINTILIFIGGLATLIYKIFYGTKTLSDNQFKTIAEAYTKFTDDELPMQQLRYVRIIGYYPSEIEISYFKNELNNSLAKIEQYAKHRSWIRLREPDGKLVFDGGLLAYWLHKFLAIMAFITWLNLIKWNLDYLILSRSPHAIIMLKEIFVHLLASMLFLIIYCFAGAYLKEKLIFWKKIDPTMKDESTSPTPISKFLKTFLLKIKALFF
jgi:hypothetical protein